MSPKVRHSQPVMGAAGHSPSVASLTAGGQMSVDTMLVQIMGTLARHDQKFDGLDCAIAKLDSEVVNLAGSVRDLGRWKERIWGMVVLAGGLFAAGASLWAIIGTHISWHA
jgi:hypothetical protein